MWASITLERPTPYNTLVSHGLNINRIDVTVVLWDLNKKLCIASTKTLL